MSYRKLALRRTVIVNLTTGTALRGALLNSTRDTLVLGSTEYIEPGSDPVPVPGTVIVERARIDFVQLVA